MLCLPGIPVAGFPGLLVCWQEPLKLCVLNAAPAHPSLSGAIGCRKETSSAFAWLVRGVLVKNQKPGFRGSLLPSLPWGW